MSKRSKACEFHITVRKDMYERDGKKCIFCSSPQGVPNMHYIPRSAGGLGIKENGVTGCPLCHHEADNGKNTQWYKEFMKNYLEKLYPDFTDAQRIYDKWRVE